MPGKKIVAIVQARMGSTRLPGKVMMKLEGKPLLERLIERLKSAKTLSRIVVATSDKAKDKRIIALSRKLGVEFFKGSENNVLERFYRAAKKNKADVIVRITADCPLIEPSVIDRCVKYFVSKKKGVDYVSNTIVRTFPKGLDTEVFSFEALEKVWKEAKSGYDTEHVTPYIYNNPKTFRLSNIKNAKDLSGMRWTVDYKEDLEFARKVYSMLRKKKNFVMGDVLNLIKKHPDIAKINEAK